MLRTLSAQVNQLTVVLWCVHAIVDRLDGVESRYQRFRVNIYTRIVRNHNLPRASSTGMLARESPSPCLCPEVPCDGTLSRTGSRPMTRSVDVSTEKQCNCEIRTCSVFRSCGTLGPRAALARGLVRCKAILVVVFTTNGARNRNVRLFSSARHGSSQLTRDFDQFSGQVLESGTLFVAKTTRGLYSSNSPGCMYSRWW